MIGGFSKADGSSFLVVNCTQSLEGAEKRLSFFFAYVCCPDASHHTAQVKRGLEFMFDMTHFQNISSPNS